MPYEGTVRCANTRTQRSSVKSGETVDVRTWKWDERRKISNYKKSNDTAQEQKAASKDEGKLAIRSPVLKTSL